MKDQDPCPRKYTLVIEGDEAGYNAYVPAVPTIVDTETSLGKAKSSWRFEEAADQIFAFGYRFRIQTTNISDARMVESRPCRTNAQRANCPVSLISASVAGGSNSPANRKSTTADLGLLGSGRPAVTTSAIPTTPDFPPL